MKVKIKKNGDELVLIIPISSAADLNIKQGSIVEVSFEQRRLVVESVAETDYTLEELLAGVTKRNLHAEIDTVKPELE
ncbi:MAG: AbrB/MazE/SpoVT family DNA-binding domain-containing protein [Acidobacteria bacterium]|nr:AbrB/MazE/SpoVT family DNA-binding domain-containing protein [Acidobacteriota bacterium]MCA1640797.1 AbrB/MazE/SpoVT family DNA-binding domain-containing protein [Acidobacteriota bacterium]